MAPSPTTTRPSSSSLRSRFKKVPLSFVLARGSSRGGERFRRCRFDSSLGASSAGVGTWHEVSTPRRWPRLLRARPSTALDERRPKDGPPITSRSGGHCNPRPSGQDLPGILRGAPGGDPELAKGRGLRPPREDVVSLRLDTVQNSGLELAHDDPRMPLPPWDVAHPRSHNRYALRRLP